MVQGRQSVRGAASGMAQELRTEFHGQGRHAGMVTRGRCDVEGRQRREEIRMNELEREALGAIWRLCDQMSYAAQAGYRDTLKAQFDTLKKHMAKLDLIEQAKGKVS